MKGMRGFLGVALCAAAWAASAAGVDIGKHCYDVIWGRAGNDYAQMLKANLDEWNFAFRPYGAQTDWLLFDSNTKRDVAGGASSKSSHVRSSPGKSIAIARRKVLRLREQSHATE